MKFKVIYSLTVAVIGARGAILLPLLPLGSSADSTPLPVRDPINGPILVVDQRGERGSQVQIGARSPRPLPLKGRSGTTAVHGAG